MLRPNPEMFELRASGKTGAFGFLMTVMHQTCKISCGGGGGKLVAVLYRAPERTREKVGSRSEP